MLCSHCHPRPRENRMPVTCRHLAVHGQHSPREVVEKTTLKVDWERAEREVAKRVPKVQRTATKWFNGTRDLVTVKQIEEAIIAEDPNLVTGSQGRSPSATLTWCRVQKRVSAG